MARRLLLILTIFLAGCSEVTQVTSGTCGNSILESGEQCDTVTEVKCEDIGLAGGPLSCSGSCRFNASLCRTRLCGNGLIDPGEQCDSKDLGGKTCRDIDLGCGYLTCTEFCTFDASHCDRDCLLR